METVGLAPEAELTRNIWPLLGFGKIFVPLTDVIGIILTVNKTKTMNFYFDS